ncbi:MAG: CHAT domain-containing protein [Deltaproteobacteria bacterium]|nr:CHAT domain-containing protein [Deltaproteobacteria bacterium]
MPRYWRHVDEIVQRAGALAVLASLWPLNDLSTAELMREFCRQRYVDGKNKMVVTYLKQIYIKNSSLILELTFPKQ